MSEVKNKAGNWDFNPMPKSSYPPGGHHDGSMQTTEKEAWVNNLKEKQVYTDKDPSGKSLKEPGTKGDSGKSPVTRGALAYFPRALLEVARVSERGALKYSWMGWASVPNGVERYGDALGRHLLQEAIEGPIDKDTGMLHKAQIAWNALAQLELILKEKEKNVNLDACGCKCSVSSNGC